MRCAAPSASLAMFETIGVTLLDGTINSKGRCVPVRAARPRRRRMHMKNLLTIFAISSMLVLSACNTVKGAGRDVESVGDCADGVKGNC